MRRRIVTNHSLHNQGLLTNIPSEKTARLGHASPVLATVFPPNTAWTASADISITTSNAVANGAIVATPLASAVLATAFVELESARAATVL